MNKKTIYIVVAVIVIALAAAAALFVMYGPMKKATPVPEKTVELKNDTTQSIDKALNNITVDDVDKELMDIDKAIEGL